MTTYRITADTFATLIHGVTGRPVEEQMLSADQSFVYEEETPDEYGMVRFLVTTDDGRTYRYEAMHDDIARDSEVLHDCEHGSGTSDELGRVN